MFRHSASALIALTVLRGVPAEAADPAIADRSHAFYFNRPGATVAELDAATADCEAKAARTTSTANAGGGLAGLLVAGIASGMQKAVERGRNLETCMVVAGWREVVLDAADGDRLKADVARDRVATLAPITAADPVTFGTIGRVWRNDYAVPVEAVAP